MLLIQHLHSQLESLANDILLEVGEKVDLGEKSLLNTINGKREATEAEKIIFEKAYGISAKDLFRQLRTGERLEVQFTTKTYPIKRTKV